jgi:lysophospholipase L1-like esterase
MNRFAIGLMALGSLLLMGVAASVATIPPARLQTQRDTTTILFTAERGYVLFPQDCVEIAWDVQNMYGVFVRGAVVETPASQKWCVDVGAAPQLTVRLLDNSDVTFTLDIVILTLQPLFMGMLLVGVLALGSGLVLTLSGRMTRQMLFSDQTLARVTRTLIGGVLLIGVMWAAVDGLLRWYFSTYGSVEQKILYVYSVEEIRALTTIVLNAPYVSYVPNPVFPDHNELGYRGAETTLTKPDGVFRIVALGGSTTYSTGTTAEEAYPAVLQQILRDEYGYTNVEVINGGVQGYTSWEVLTHFAFRVLELEPDMLIFYESVNELSVRENSSSACYRGENAMRGLNPQRGLFVERTPPYPQSTLVRFIGIYAGWIRNPLGLETAFDPPQIPCPPDNAPSIEARLAANPPVYYERNLRNLVLIAQGNGVQPMFSSWAYNVDANRPTVWREQIAAQNAVLRNLATELDVPFYDLAANFPVGPQYWERDGWHMEAPGTLEQATQYARWLHDGGYLPAPP